MNDFSKLKAWQVAYAVGLDIYNLACRFPHPHLYALGAQMQRAAISLSNNISEGFGRRRSKDKAHLYTIGYSSGNELKNCLFFARDTGLIPLETVNALLARLDEACRLANGLIEGMEKWVDP